ncbi:MAG: hypothetical protein IPK82_27200 [Polyangiaceae bacterium]|nr:hypothetical protein [Polyangiaceae bacterium]
MSTLVSGEGKIGAIATIGKTVVWADATNQLIRIRDVGDSSAARTLIDNQLVADLTADTATIFWSTQTGSLWAWSLESNSGRLLAVDIGDLGAVKADATHVYFVTSDDDGGIARVAK